MHTCFLFPGQGAQYPGMGKDLYDTHEEVRSLFELAADSSGRDVESLMFNADEGELKETINTQIVVTLMNLALRRYLKKMGVESEGAAGFSLGEWSAYVDTGVLTEEQVFPLVIRRAELMAEAAEKQPKLKDGSAMAAVMGLDPQIVEETLSGMEDVYPANYNSSVQTVISGSAPAVESAGTALKEAGAKRVIPLKVSGPFHTPLLEAAAKGFAEYLGGYEFKRPTKPLYSNVSGSRVTEPEEIRRNASLQIISPVRWKEEIHTIAAGDYERCIECGPGKVLTGLWKKNDTPLTCIPADDAANRENLILS
ncbi:MAG: ACP S-malonyltransferase [Sediminispirochaetaceae bacterium]